MSTWRKCFGGGPVKLIGMIHVPALHGTPGHLLSVSEIVKTVDKEARIYKSCGVDGVLVENMYDVPYQQPKEIRPETTALMTRVCAHVRSVLPSQVPCGVQVLAGANQEAVAVALAADLQFIRCEGFVFGHLADEGWMNSCAASLMRYRRQISAQHVLVFTDIKKKHSSHAVTSDVSIGETAAAAEFFLSDGVIVTGSSTGHAAEASDLESVRKHCSLPVLIGSGVNAENVAEYSNADGLIVGSYFKQTGKWNSELDEKKVGTLVEKIKNLRLSIKSTVT